VLGFIAPEEGVGDTDREMTGVTHRLDAELAADSGGTERREEEEDAADIAGGADVAFLSVSVFSGHSKPTTPAIAPKQS
jgi:hypothetical protein